MEKFIQRFSDKITGALSGLDRLMIRGTIRPISLHSGMREFAYQNGVLLKDFGAYSQNITSRIREVSHEIAEKGGRPFIYVPSPKTNKEEIALKVLKEKPVETGLICMLSCVEPCNSFQVVRCPETKKIQLRGKERMCLHIYHYLIHPIFGFMNVRFQTWFPLNIQICINGREWLSRQMNLEQIEFQRLDNCFPWISNSGRAQQLMMEQLKLNWPSALNPIIDSINPLHSTIFKKIPMEYYWSTPQSEWATDIMFKSRSDLAEIYPAIVQHAVTSFSSHDVMRFLGRKLHGRFEGEVRTDYKERLEGIRIKHIAGNNSIKIYDKFQIVLRIETTIYNPRDFSIFRPLETHPQKKLAWQRLRQGVADLHRRAEVSQASNERYLNALAEIDCSVPLGRLLQQISAPVYQNGKRFRALRPSDSNDLALFKAVTDARFMINGFRNRDLQQILYQNPPDSQKEAKRRSARISRLIKLLRVHHLVRRVPHTYRYLLTSKGSQILTALFSANEISLEQLKSKAA